MYSFQFISFSFCLNDPPVGSYIPVLYRRAIIKGHAFLPKLMNLFEYVMNFTTILLGSRSFFCCCFVLFAWLRCKS